MNIQIFGSKKSNDSKKAERWFKERGIRFQFIDLREKDMSRGEFTSVLQAVGGTDELIDDKCKDKQLVTLMNYLSPEDKTEKLFENQQALRTPIVRNGKKATVGYSPDVWEKWE